MDIDAITAERPPETVDLAVTGMTCAACVNRVEKVLSRVPGGPGPPSTSPRRPRSWSASALRLAGAS
jgi:hypothetical protein